ncbi:DUF2254 domain-containing protein [Cyclobacterium qasimii]|uniref:DUF2254 domain-containing protein n=2 Tax=Cyclobacterium qasimii TaxID=1350429 RepID=S7VAY2_9BACT|nr:DUF2254 domain-containing protein [Cyclobacterium qasimii]EPR67141.1 hypothetical protein ADICYQ_3845 [Cyclobacterium qasimii M12-11B]GEO23988.1 hypothetical protein CQA01_45220 [Cyclobacterium qasimii]
MKKLLFWWSKLKSTFWFVPVLIIALGIALPFWLVYLDSTNAFEPKGGWKYLFPSSPNAAKDILSTIAGAMIGVAGTVFSITLVALTLASSQFGPRLIKNFMYDRINQTVLGTYVSLYIYCLIVLNTVKDTDQLEFVPIISVFFALVMTIGNILLLIIFIHHVANSIQADNIIGKISKNLSTNLKVLFPEQIGKAASSTFELEEVRSKFSYTTALKSNKEGYLQYIDAETLMEEVSDKDLFLELYFRPGDYLFLGREMGKIYSHKNLSDEELETLKDNFLTGRTRTSQQDAEHAIHQMVEIAARALSPGVNDPYTAIACIDNLSNTMAYLTTVKFPSSYRIGAHDRLRIYANALTFEGMMDAAFNAIRQYSKGNPPVIIHLMAAMAILWDFAEEQHHKEVIKKHAKMILNLAEISIDEKNDLEDLQERFDAIKD